MNQVILLLSTFIFGGIALACPNLRGTYLCKQNSYHKDTKYTFSQKIVNYQWQFTMAASTPENTALSSFTFLTDNFQREITDTVSGQKLLATAKCEDDKLKVYGTAQIGEVAVNFSEDLSLNQGGDLINISLDIYGNVVEEICFRN